MSELSPPRIVCAANKHPVSAEIAVGVRHFCPVMHGNILRFKGANDENSLYGKGWRQSEQGFIDQHGVFYTREEAWVIAEKNGQIIGDHDWCTGSLHSEHLY